jgi:hypothetical protein
MRAPTGSFRAMQWAQGKIRGLETVSVIFTYRAILRLPILRNAIRLTNNVRIVG